MSFADYATQIRALGSQIDPEVLAATRALVAPLLGELDTAGISIMRDLAYGPDPRQRLDLFTAANAAVTARPTLVFVHGGGFVAGDKHTEGSPFYSNIGLWAVRQGFNGVNLTYRLAPQHQWPSGIEDLHLAIQFLQQHTRAQGGDQGPVFLMGQSAGAAHVASYIAHPEIYPGQGHGLAGAILLSGIYDYTSAKPGPLEQSYLGSDTTQYQARSSLAGLLQSGLPLLLCLAEMDPPIFEQQTLQLLGALQSKCQPPAFLYAIGQNHLSQALYLGLDGDLLGPQLVAFIRAHADSES